MYNTRVVVAGRNNFAPVSFNLNDVANYHQIEMISNKLFTSSVSLMGFGAKSVK